MERHLIDLALSRALDPALAGGKGANLARLIRLAPRSRDPKWHVPRGLVVTTHAFARHVLEGATGKLIAAGVTLESAANVRAMIRALPFPRALRVAIGHACAKLGGGPVAVRSSSTHEDGRHHAAAGYGQSVLGVEGLEPMCCAILDVWASQFSEAFIHAGVTAASRMAVILQPMVNADHAGIAFSSDPVTGRPGFHVQACEGLGDGVADGNARVGTWFVAPEADAILERDASGIALPAGEAVLRIARVVECIRGEYEGAGIASEIDIEFALAANEIVVLQARPMTALAAPGTPVETSFVIADERSAGALRVTLAGTTASRGVASGRLQVIRDPAAFDTVKSGAIVAVLHTSNRWTGVFAVARGFITVGGNDNSHAAVCAREAGIPAIVGSESAFERLARLDGAEVTLDADARVLYEGRMAIGRRLECNNRWVARAALQGVVHKEREEAARRARLTPYEDLKLLRQTRLDWEGCWLGKPAIPYGYFELDYYSHGWARGLDPRLRRLGVPVRHVCHVKHRILWHAISDSMEGLTKRLGLDRLEALLLAHRETFSRAERFFGALRRIDASNVGDFEGHLVRLLSHMHFAFELTVGMRRHEWRHLRYVSEPEQAALRTQALRRDFALSPRERHSERREKDAALEAVAARVRADDRLRALFADEDPARIAALLADLCPALLDEIHGFSARFKMGSEDLRITDDTPVYLRTIGALVSGAPQGISFERLMVFCEEYVDPAGGQTPAELLDRLLEESPETLPLAEEHASVCGKTVSEVGAAILSAWRERDRQGECLARYPQMARALSLSAQAAQLRDDGHELMCRFQRIAAPLMREAGQAAVRAGALTDPEEVFDLALGEFQAIVMDPAGASFPGHTHGRWRLVEAADDALDAAWREADSSHPCGGEAWHSSVTAALTGYRYQLVPVFDCLQDQLAGARQARQPAAAVAYRKERLRLLRRLALLEARAAGGHRGCATPVP